MTFANRRLLGFDAREDEQDCKKTPIPENVRETMLLRSEIECPFSVDVSIWPSLFLYYPQFRQMIGPSEPPLIETDSDCGDGLWLSLARMRRRVAENRRAAIFIAVDLVAPKETTVSEFPSPLIYSIPDPQSLPEGTTILGFDVADSGSCSGLSNCGYSEEQRERLRPEWRSKINDYGLLQTEEDALIFKELTDTRVPEHAPFWVYKLYRLSDS